MPKKYLAAIAALFLFTGHLALASAGQISFGIDCMIHDGRGGLLSDLGMIGAMTGQYTASQTFQYKNLKIEADLNGPFLETPEVATPQLKLTVVDSKGGVLAALVTSANPDVNAALFVPTEGVYLHCDKMDM